MARKGKSVQYKKEKIAEKGKIKSKKKDGVHIMNRLKFESRTQEKIYDKLVIEFVQNHLPKILDIVPKEVRRKRGDEPNLPGKLYKEEIQTMNSKNAYIKRAKTFIKWHVTKKKITSLAEIDKNTTSEFFNVLAMNTGRGSGQYSKKTYDAYIDGTYKLFQSLSRTPESAKVVLEGRHYAAAIPSFQKLLSRDFKEELRNRVGQYSKKEYKRGSGYTSSQASTIMRQAEKHMNTRDQLLVATLVYAGLRNDEVQKMRSDFYKNEKSRIELIEKGVTKQDRGRFVLDVHPKVFKLVEKLKEEEGLAATDYLFSGYNDKKVREVIKTCCKEGKIKYSGVHDLRKAYIERNEREWISKIRKSKVEKSNLIERIMTQVGAKPTLNPVIKIKEVRFRNTKEGKKKRYYVYKRNDGKIIEERKYTIGKLQKMTIEDLLDRYMAENLGHSDPETTFDYRLPKTASKRKEFRKEMREVKKFSE
ncbi:hypothetical protein QL992_17705 [Microbacterium sp. APC 3898]|uniref:Tyr recombinase domain-containing protein n=1 Tax=Planococcus notacanthi TaxID=3035188 RepID=A0ABT7ZPZ3_9BACL|nr:MULTISPECIES: hypothetical protein [Terrabacteria group]MDN3429158.1 hypothetical protein [Planococcus sp. APC 4016]MDN3501060.1 hypothetical protein [Microbacterium sp. APC 3898]